MPEPGADFTQEELERRVRRRDHWREKVPDPRTLNQPRLEADLAAEEDRGNLAAFALRLLEEREKSRGQQAFIRIAQANTELGQALVDEKHARAKDIEALRKVLVGLSGPEDVPEDLHDGVHIGFSRVDIVAEAQARVAAYERSEK